MYFSDYPIISTESELPLYVENIGINKREGHILRKDGLGHHMIIYCTKGSGTLILNKKRYKIKPKMGFYIPADFPHEYYPDEEIWDTHWVLPEGYACEETLKHFGFDKPVIFELSDTKALDHHLIKMHNAFIGDRIFGNYKVCGYLYDFLIELYRQTSAVSSQKATNSVVIKAIDYINQNFTQPITLEEICNVCKVSKQHLCRLFQLTLSSRPMEYIAKRRISASKEMLTNSTKTIDEISEECGFCTSSYFCKLFKRYEGMTPTQFRNG